MNTSDLEIIFLISPFILIVLISLLATAFPSLLCGCFRKYGDTCWSGIQRRRHKRTNPGDAAMMEQEQDLESGGPPTLTARVGNKNVGRDTATGNTKKKRVGRDTATASMDKANMKTVGKVESTWKVVAGLESMDLAEEVKSLLQARRKEEVRRHVSLDIADLSMKTRRMMRVETCEDEKISAELEE